MSNNNINLHDTLDVEKFLTTKTRPDASKRGCIPADELRWSKQSSVFPLYDQIEMSAMVHGEYSTSSTALADWISKLPLIEPELQKLKSIGDAVAVSQQATADVGHNINRINKETLHHFNTPLLRFYIGQIASLHPGVQRYILDNVDKFPYFAAVSERVGAYCTVIADLTNCPLPGWLKVDAIESDTKIATAPIPKSGYTKNFPELASSFDIADTAINCAAVRWMGKNVFAKCQVNVDAPTPHGFSCAPDVFYSAIMQSIQFPVINKVVAILKDQTRLLDHLMPVNLNVVVEDRAYQVPIGGSQTQTYTDQVGDKIFTREDSSDVLVAYEAERELEQSY